jgi:hypothetical protein
MIQYENKELETSKSNKILWKLESQKLDTSQQMTSGSILRKPKGKCARLSPMFGHFFILL